MNNETNKSLNFGRIKTSFNDVLVESLVNKSKDKNRGLFKNYIKEIKKNEILKTQFFVYSNIENKIEENEIKALQFVNENISLLSKFSKKDIIQANTKLAESLSIDENKLVDYDKKDLHNDISMLILTNRTPKTINEITDATYRIVEFVKKNKPKEVIEESSFNELPLSMMTGYVVDHFNERYSTLSETERKLFNSIIESDENGKLEIYNDLRKECLVLVNDKLKLSEGKTKEMLLEVKERLLDDNTNINENFEKNITKLIDLKGDLK